MKMSIKYSYNNNFMINIRFLANIFYPLSKLKCFPSLLIRCSVYPTQASLLDLLITSVNNFHFNFVVMFVYCANQSSVINSIYMKELILSYILNVSILKFKLRSQISILYCVYFDHCTLCPFLSLPRGG
jgi:hypothetical protein